MKLLLKANCPTNDYWAVSAFFCIQVTPDSVARLLTMREASIAFLKSQDIEGWGHVKLPTPLAFSVSEDEKCNELLEPAEVGYIIQNDSLTLDGESHVRTDCHMVQISADSVWLHAMSKDGSDFVEAEIPLEFLCGMVFLTCPA